MIVRTVFQILFVLSTFLAGFYVALWRVKRRLQPAALMLDEGLKSIQGSLSRITMAQGHFHGRPVEMLVRPSRWSRGTFYIRTPCDSHLEFTIWSPGAEGAKTTVPVDGYAVLTGQECGRELVSISSNLFRFLAWAEEPATKQRLDILANARDNWRLELRLGKLESTDMASRKEEFAAPELPRRIEALTQVAASLEAMAEQMGVPGAPERKSQ